MALRHIVLLGFKKEAETEDAVRRFVALRDEVPGIDDFEWGLNCSPEGLNHGLTHCFTLTFATAEARDAYLPHPAHVAFADWLKPQIEVVTVVDYWTTAA
jgi:hypothetical protein